jgi:soluble lytic murein transglycosylase-like protein
MPDLMMEINDLKGMPDQALQFELAHPSGAVPAYLVLAEAQRRQTMRQAAQAQQSSQPVGSVYDDVIRDMMARQPPAGPSMAGMTPPPMAPPASPAAGNFAAPSPGRPMGMAAGGEVEDDDESDGEGEADRMDINGILLDTLSRHPNIDPNDFHAMMLAESGGDPNAVSRKGATGLFQVMPKTGRQYGATNLKDPAENAEAAANYIDYLNNKYHGDQTLVRAAYNAGEGNVDKYHGVPPFNETRQYIKRINRFKQQDPFHPTTQIDENLSGPATRGVQFSMDLPPGAPQTSTIGTPGEPAQPPDAGEAPVIPMDRVLSQIDPNTLEGQQALAIFGTGPDPGVRPAAPAAPAPSKRAVWSENPNIPPGAAVTPVAQTKPDAASDDFAVSRQRIQEMYDDLKKRQHPSIWTFLRDFGAGMAATPARNWQQSLAGGVTGMIRSRSAEEENMRQEQLKLLGVSLDLDKQVREHQDRIAQLTATAQNQAWTHSNTAYQNALKIPGQFQGLQNETHPGYTFVSNPMDPGRGAWTPSRVQIKDPSVLDKLGINPETGVGYKLNDWVAPADLEKLNAKIGTQETRNPEGAPQQMFEGAVDTIARRYGIPNVKTYKDLPEMLTLKNDVTLGEPVIKADGTMTPAGTILKAGTVVYPRTEAEWRNDQVTVQKNAMKGAAQDPFAGIDPKIVAASYYLQPGQRNEDLLKALPAGDRNVVREIVDYRYPMPTSGMAMARPEWQRILSLANAYDPTFDASQYQQRQKLMNGFKSGTQSQVINALNTATQHVDRLEKNWAALNNYGGWATLLNAPANRLAH